MTLIHFGSQIAPGRPGNPLLPPQTNTDVRFEGSRKKKGLLVLAGGLAGGALLFPTLQGIVSPAAGNGPPPTGPSVTRTANPNVKEQQDTFVKGALEQNKGQTTQQPQPTQVPPTPTQPPPPSAKPSEPMLDVTALEASVAKTLKQYGLHSVDISSIDGESVLCLGCEKSPASVASLIKLPIGLAALKEMERQGLNLDSPITVYPGVVDDTERGGSFPETVSLRHALDKMLHGAGQSNTYANTLAVFASGKNPPANTSARNLLDVSTKQLNDRLASYGLKNTRFVNFLNVQGDQEPAPNQSTLADISKAMQQLSTGDAPGFKEARKSLAGSYTPFSVPEPEKTAVIRKKGGWNNSVTAVSYVLKAPNGEQYVITLAKNQQGAYTPVSDAVSEINKALVQAS